MTTTKGLTHNEVKQFAEIILKANVEQLKALRVQITKALINRGEQQ